MKILQSSLLSKKEDKAKFLSLSHKEQLQQNQLYLDRIEERKQEKVMNEALKECLLTTRLILLDIILAISLITFILLVIR